MADDDGSDRADNIADRRQERKTRRSRGRGRDSQTNNTDVRNEASGSDDSTVNTEVDSTASVDDVGERDETDESDNTDGTPVREQTHVAMYLSPKLADDLDLRFDELSLEYRKEHGEKMTKNGDFYPALAEAAINDTTLREELGLSDSDE